MNEVYINSSLFRFKDFSLSAKADRLLEGSEAGSAGRFPLTFSETSETFDFSEVGAEGIFVEEEEDLFDGLNASWTVVLVFLFDFDCLEDMMSVVIACIMTLFARRLGLSVDFLWTV